MNSIIASRPETWRHITICAKRDPCKNYRIFYYETPSQKRLIQHNFSTSLEMVQYIRDLPHYERSYVYFEDNDQERLERIIQKELILKEKI